MQVVTTHLERMGMDPHVPPRVILGVDREDARWSDDDVIDVGVLVSDRDGVDDMPALAEPLQPTSDRHLARRADPERTLVRVNPENPGNEGLHRSRSSKLFGLLKHCLARFVGR